MSSTPAISVAATRADAAKVPTEWASGAMRRRISARYRSEAIFKWIGFGAVLVSVGFLAFLLVNMAIKGIPGFFRTELQLQIPISAVTLNLSQAQMAGKDKETALSAADFSGVLTAASVARFGPDGATYIADTAWTTLREAVTADPTLIGKSVKLWVPVSGNIDLVAKGKDPAGNPSGYRRVYDEATKAGIVRTGFNGNFLTAADSSDPVSVGIWGAFKGSMLTMLVTLVLSFPVGVLSALYLEEYAPRNRWTDMIEVSINNLAAVPSIIFGLLGLAVFLGTFNMPRSAPIIGGLTLALMTMPVIVIAGA